jgi:hypothetical protein
MKGIDTSGQELNSGGVASFSVPRDGVSHLASDDLMFKVVKFKRDENGKVVGQTTLQNSKVVTQAEADAYRDEYLRKNENNIKKGKLNEEDIAVIGGKYARAVKIAFNSDLSLDKIKRISTLFGNTFEDGVFTQSATDEIILVNYHLDDVSHVPGIYNEDFIDSLGEFIKEHGADLGITRVYKLWVEGDQNATEERGESYEGGRVLDKGIASRRSDLFSWVVDRGVSHQELLERYSGEQLRRAEEELRTSLFQKAPPVGSARFDDETSENEVST